jgi:hypothetical protein
MSGGCTSHAQCLEKNGDLDPTVCVEGECVPLRTDECPVLLPMRNDQWLESLKSSNALILGAFSPVPKASFVSNFTRFDDLAVTELSEEVMGLPGPNGKRREIVMVVCDGATPKRETLAKSSSHLIDELAVPGIVSTLQSADLQYVFEEKASDAGTFIISALDADESILNLKDQGLVWTMLTGAEQVAVPVAPLLDRVVAYLRKTDALAADEDVRVALVAPTGEPRLLNDMGAAIKKSIHFNGASATDNYPDNFRAIDIVTVYDDADKARDQSKVVSQLLDFMPHVVIAMASNEFLSAAIPGVEGQWDTLGDAPRPFYILSPYHLGASDIGTALQSAPNLERRMVGVAYASATDTSVYKDYLIRLEQAYPEITNDKSYEHLENFYDAPYYLLYATAAAGNPPRLTGSALAQGMTRLLSGPTYDIGRDDMVEALGLLQSNSKSTITLNGTLGPASFDPATGARADAGSVFCINGLQQFISDVLRWDATAKKFIDADPAIGSACIKSF